MASSARLGARLHSFLPHRTVLQLPALKHHLRTIAQYAKVPQPPPRFTATPDSLVADVKRLLAASRALQDDIVKNVTPETATFTNVALPLARKDDQDALETRIIAFYQAVSTDQNLRNASSEAEKLLNNFRIESAMREDIFKLFDAALNRKEHLNPESQRLLESAHRDYIHGGIEIPAGPKRDRFKEIQKRLSELTIAFRKTLSEENGGIWFTREELDGVPTDVIDHLQKGGDGKVRLTFKYPDLFPTLKYAKSEATRKILWIENENKCNSNVQRFREIIILRHEAACLLGYKNHAEFRIKGRIAQTPDRVNNFLSDLRTQLAPLADAEHQNLLALKESDLKSRNATFDGKLYLWDYHFYDRLMLEKNYSLDHEKFAEYFPLASTVRGMLRIFGEVFGLVFHEIKDASRNAIPPTSKSAGIIWHPDVWIFSVWNDEGEGSEFAGYLYLDLFPREGKYGHAANFNLQPGFIIPKGSRRYPATAIVCNFSRPTPKKPSLLKHGEMVTLFHELGHGIHDLVSRTTHSRFHGTSTVRDFVEAPSQLLENWGWTSSQLQSLSKHWSHLGPEYAATWAETNAVKQKQPEAIPDELTDSIIKARHVNRALFNLRKVHLGIFDMTVHTPSNHDAIKALPISETYNRFRSEISGMHGPEILGSGWDRVHGEATFGHLMEGYDAGYYGYLFSQVFSTDIFDNFFKQIPICKAEGRRYRHMLLEKGGSEDEMKNLEEFLGRKSTPEAFHLQLGLAANRCQGR